MTEILKGMKNSRNNGIKNKTVGKRKITNDIDKFGKTFYSLRFWKF